MTDIHTVLLLVHPNFSSKNEQFINNVIMNSSNPTYGPLSFVRAGPKAGFKQIEVM